MHRFYVQQKFPVGEVFVESLQIVHQLTKVLRMKPGEVIIFFNGDGYDYPAEIIMYVKNGLRCIVREKIKNIKESSKSLVLHQSLIKKDHMELVLEKATEIGISEFRPCISVRSIKKDFPMERGKKIIREAAEQSGRAIVPLLFEPVSFSDSLQYVQSVSGLGVIFHPDTDDTNDLPAFFEILKKSHRSSIHLFIGPEGGFTEEELKDAKMKDFFFVSLFPTILRAETAAIVFSGIVATTLKHRS